MLVPLPLLLEQFFRMLFGRNLRRMLGTEVFQIGFVPLQGPLQQLVLGLFLFRKICEETHGVHLGLKLLETSLLGCDHLLDLGHHLIGRFQVGLCRFELLLKLVQSLAVVIAATFIRLFACGVREQRLGTAGTVPSRSAYNSALPALRRTFSAAVDAADLLEKDSPEAATFFGARTKPG